MVRRIALGVAITLLAAGAATAAAPPGKTFPIKVAVVKGKVKTYGFKVSVELPSTMTLGPGLAPSVTGGNNAKAPKGVQAAAGIASTGKSTWEIVVVVDGRKAAAGGTVAATVSLTGPLAGVPATEKPDPKVCTTDEVAQKSFADLIYVLIGPSAVGKRTMQLYQTGCVR
jgi:hypothetical protein